MARRSAARGSIGIVVVAMLAGCGSSPQARYYTLESTAKADGSTPASYGVAVGPISIPAAVDRPQFVVQVAPNRVRLDEFERWAAPLDDSIGRAVAGNLTVLLGSPRVTTAALANFDPTYRVAIDIQRFDSIPGEAALVEAVWSVRASAGGEARSGRTSAREPVQGEGFDGLAAAHSRALAKVCIDIAAAIRAEAEKKP